MKLIIIYGYEYIGIYEYIIFNKYTYCKQLIYLLQVNKYKIALKLNSNSYAIWFLMIKKQVTKVMDLVLCQYTC